MTPLLSNKQQITIKQQQSRSRVGVCIIMANAIKLTDIRKENKECKSSVKGCIKYLYANDGKETKKLLALYGSKEVVYGLADRIATDMHIGEQAKTKDGGLRTSKAGKAIIVKVSVDLVARWFVANQEQALEIAEGVKQAQADKQARERAEKMAQAEAAKASKVA